MIYFGQDPQEIISAGMRLTEHELSRLKCSKLKGASYEVPNGYRCVKNVKGNTIQLGTYKTIEQCNTAFDNDDIERKIKEVEKKLSNQGYRVNGRGENKSFLVLRPDGTWKTYHDKDVARLAFVEQINAEIEELRKQIKPIEKLDNKH